MRLKQVMFGLTFLYHLKFLNGKENIEILNLITDFIVKLNAPVKVNAYVCWTTDTKLMMWKQLSLNNINAHIGKTTDNLTYTLPTDHQLFLLDLSCTGSDKILEKASQLNLFALPFRWIVWGQKDHSNFKDFYFRLDSQVFVIEKNNDKYHIKSLYKLAKNSLKYLENDLAIWEGHSGFLQYNAMTFLRSRTNLMGMNINISYVTTNPDTKKHLEDYRQPHIDPLSKVNWFVMQDLILILNASTSPLFQTTWGYREANSSRFTGMIGDLQSGAAEFGGTALFFTIDRIDEIDYIAPSVSTFAKFIFRAPPVSYVSNVFTLPFDSYVWYSCFALVPLIFIVVYTIVIWEWKDPVFKEKVDEPHSYMSPLRPRFLDVLVMELGAITQQGTDTEPKSNAGRIATVFAFIAFMFLYTSYSANIVAILQSTTESIKTLDDLLNSRISLGVEDIVYGHYYFKTAEEPVKKAIYEQKIAPKGQKENFMTIAEGMDKVRNGFFAFHVEVSNGYKVVADTFQENEKCGLKEIAFVNIPEPWVSIKKRSPYKEIVKVGLRKIKESGVQKRVVNRIYTKKPICHNKGSSFGSAGILDCYAAFLIYAIGISISLLLLFFEILVHRRFKQMYFGKIRIFNPAEEIQERGGLNKIKDINCALHQSY